MGLDAGAPAEVMHTSLKYRLPSPSSVEVLWADGVIGLCSGRQSGSQGLALNYVPGLAHTFLR